VADGLLDVAVEELVEQWCHRLPHAFERATTH
jgi:hypothetical protein